MQSEQSVVLQKLENEDWKVSASSAVGASASFDGDAKIIEGLIFDQPWELAAVNVPNTGSLVPGLPEDAVIEVPANASKKGLEPWTMPQLPTGPLALLNTQTAINKLLVEAFLERSKKKLLQAVLLDPTVDSYQNAVHCINELCELQKEVLVKLEW